MLLAVSQLAGAAHIQILAQSHWWGNEISSFSIQDCNLQKQDAFALPSSYCTVKPNKMSVSELCSEKRFMDHLEGEKHKVKIFSVCQVAGNQMPLSLWAHIYVWSGHCRKTQTEIHTHTQYTQWASSTRSSGSKETVRPTLASHSSVLGDYTAYVGVSWSCILEEYVFKEVFDHPDRIPWISKYEA